MLLRKNLLTRQKFVAMIGMCGRRLISLVIFQILKMIFGVAVIILVLIKIVLMMFLLIIKINVLCRMWMVSRLTKPVCVINIIVNFYIVVGNMLIVLVRILQVGVRLVSLLYFDILTLSSVIICAVLALFHLMVVTDFL